MTEIGDQVLELLPKLDRPTLERVTRLYVESVGYLDEHKPEHRERGTWFPCSGEAYHLCSFSSRHDPGCKAVGGNGDVSANGHSVARTCEPDCDSSGTEEPWCRCSGFDCPECEFVDELIGVIAAHS